MKAINEIFPILGSTVWLAEREKAWAVAEVECELKKNHRKKELLKIRKYYFTGELGSDNPIEGQIGTKLYFFPVQSSVGYDYFYKNNVITEKQLLSITMHLFSDQSDLGFTEQEQLEHWDYHLGKTFQPAVTRETKDGPISIELDAREIVSNIIGYLVLHLDSGSYSQNPKWFVNLPYLFSAIEYAEDTLFRDEPILAFKWLFSDVLAIRHGTYTGELNAYAIDFANKFMEFMNSSKKIDTELLKLFRKIELESKV